MDFYTLDYIISQQSTDWTMRVISILALLLVCLVFSVLYMRDRMRTRWRDLGVGTLILSLVLVGIQTEQYLDLSDQAAQSKQLVLFVKGVAQDQKISTDEVLVNSTSLKDGIIVRFKDENYRVHLNEDNNSYTLERTHIIDHNVYVDGKH
ncbi:MAG: DUF3290 domain-containing protein [Actinomyces graevenitzii]|mgnify:FL=1|jgi:hypothetical protein|uniref:DUF3290 domain-containing protein n=3 Tax=Actinomyces graevenitzii TaxID=55565 RepID=G9PHE2_9ACTO|nr:DUF3290 domain-containing protein [Actinomyces graevenitzii]EHM87291.1 hypothetical protein HMPREF0045_01670 [Actinomyces graevenitzii C83]ERH17397.1 hypothetical protein HMPREF1978_00559 [Actinomyces graevenitzii F0530]MBF0972220.1 DUF3290 domain-containing protein [Actinomyces graevenitzii]MBS5244574.1 DUF3290 domain-containing protein [Actinomyces graevenitzii]MBS6671523.1 DUF3290 domain-containing protein [Actinomyces graevenitzii]